MNATGQVSVVVLTHNRVSELARTLHRLEGLADAAHIVVVDNASTDGTGTHVQRHFPRVELVHCEKNLGAAARNLGVACVDTPYVAFCDDDTWWAEGSLHKACALLARHPHLAAVAARVLVGEREVVDPTCERMAASPLPPAGLPGPRLAAFMAGAVVMRTDAYREVGGYDERLFLGAEEALMALDLLVLGWQMMYSHKVVVHHHPSGAREAGRRRVMLLRNQLWIAWLRLPFADAAARTRTLLREAARHGVLVPCVAASMRGLGWVLQRRQVVPCDVRDLWQQAFLAPSPRRAGQPDTRAGGTAVAERQ